MRSPRIRGIIFDLDGVLVHTDELHFTAWAAIAGELGIPFDRTVNARLRGVSRAESLAILLEGKPTLSLSEAERDALCEKKNRLYRKSLTTLTPADIPPETRELLAGLRARGIRPAIGSSSRNAPLILEQVGLTDAFDAVVDGSMLTAAKPDPEVFLRAATLLRLAPSACAVVEDAPAGIQAARRAGMVAIGLGEFAARAEPDVCLQKLSELTDWLQ